MFYILCHAAAVDVTFPQELLYVVAEGGTVEINCSVTGSPAPTEINFFTLSGVLLNGTGTDGPNERVTLSNLTEPTLAHTETISGEAVDFFLVTRTLTITDAMVEDSISYVCSTTTMAELTKDNGFTIEVESMQEQNLHVLIITLFQPFSA